MRTARYDGSGHGVAGGECSPSTPPPGFERASLRAMRKGTETILIGARRVRVDADTCIVVNPGSNRSSRYGGAGSVAPISVSFAPALLAQALRAADDDDDDATLRTTCVFLEALQVRSGAVAAHLDCIERRLRQPHGDDLWWDERVALLLAASIAADRMLQRRAAMLPARKAATRCELLRRVLMASDYIQSTYEQPITLQDIAASARLSRFHLVRLFQCVHGLAPHAYLTRKRVDAARRLLAQTGLGLDEIAARSGLGSRSSLFRHLRRVEGSGASALRAQWLEREPCTSSA
ncbi:MAG: helix-turn-helix transcriptional regulator [Proteobacteria bacterium]|nr:helix-turn-helix transcriptional regulator [Pseudomonadota bacterium]